MRSVAKTFSWRLIIFIYWVIFGYIYTGTFSGAGILGVGSIIPLLFYYFQGHRQHQCLLNSVHGLSANHVFQILMVLIMK